VDWTDLAKDRGTRGGPLRRFIKCWELLELAVSQEGLGSTKLIS
jgi:hypothetical protein